MCYVVMDLYWIIHYKKKVTRRFTRKASMLTSCSFQYLRCDCWVMSDVMYTLLIVRKQQGRFKEGNLCERLQKVSHDLNAEIVDQCHDV